VPEQFIVGERNLRIDVNTVEIDKPEANQNSKLRIAVIRRECTYDRGGAERYAANLCKALAGLGHQVFVVAEQCDPDLHPAIKHVPVRVNRATSGSRNSSFHQNSQRALVEIGADAVLALSRTFPADAFRVSDPLHDFWMRVWYPNRLHRFLQTLNPRHRRILRLEAAILDPANTRAIITNSELSKRLIGERGAFPAERIHVVYNGVDRRQFSPGEGFAEAEGEVRLLFVGRDFKRKGLEPLIRAVAAARKENVACRLRVIGRDRTAPYERLATELGIEEAVEFDGPTRKVEEAYRGADLFVFPTLYDPFANVCLEAMACGLPVLTTTTNGASEIVTEGVDGFVVNGEADGLAERLAAKIVAFCRKTEIERRKMRDAAAGKGAEFTIENNARVIVGILSNVSKEI